MKTKNRVIWTVIIMSCVIGTAFADNNIIDVANDDWLNLVRQHKSADILQETEQEFKWDRLVKDYENSPKKFIRSKMPETFLAQWWEALGDEVLVDLIGMAFEANRDIQAARARILEARARVGISKAAFQPKADGSARYTNGKNSYVSEGTSYNNYYLGIDASWELDFFGKNQHVLEASKANLEAEYADLNNAWVSLSAEVAMNYINLRTLQNRLKIAHDNLKIQQEILDLIESQYKAGLKDELALYQERYTLEQTRAAIPSLEQSIQENINTIALLTGEIPGSMNEFLAQAKPLPQIDTSRLIGIPAQTLHQRPDIRAAERRLEAQISTRKATEKSLYPTISFGGSIGLESIGTGKLFTSDAYGYSIGPRINLPIFNGKEILNDIKAQSAIEEQLKAALEGVILQAVKEVHDALNANAQEIVKYAALTESLKSARLALDVARDKYFSGLTDFSNVLSAQQAVYSAEDECAVSDGQKILNLIQLFKSLGGGWEPLS